LRDMNFLALLVVDFLPTDMNSDDGMVKFPTDEELKKLLEAEVGGER